MDAFISTIASIPSYIFLETSARTYWLYLVTACLIALCTSLFRGKRHKKSHEEEKGIAAVGVTEVVRSFTHRSARLDYGFFIFGRTIFFVILVPLLLSADQVSGAVTGALSQFVAPIHWEPPLIVVFSILITLCMVLVIDFSLFFGHMLFHRIGAFWEFHKVHHSAEVLNPLTIYRMHPFEELCEILFSVFLTGSAYGIIFFFFDSSVRLISVGQLNVFLFFFYLTTFNLRHSPVWISYGPFWERIFISPAQHQIHHSDQSAHFDKNFGYLFSIWDRLFGSLVIARPGMRITYGLGGEEREFSSVGRLFFLPIVKNIRNVRRFFRKNGERLKYKKSNSS